MDQRRWGIVLIAVVLLGLFVTSNLRPRVVAGSAVAEPVPGPPAVGDCVGKPFQPEAAQYLAPDGVGEIRFPTLKIRNCTGPRYGEVTHLYRDRDEVTGIPQTDGWGEACYRRGREYVGAPPAAVDPSEMRWDATLMLLTMPIGPDETQRANGQRWVACVAYTTTGHGAVDLLPSTLHNAVSTGADQGHLGLCTVGPTADHRYHSCRLPHDGQIIASGVSGQTQLTRDMVRKDCEQQIIALTGDPVRSDDGLTFRVRVLDPATGTESAENIVPPGSGLDCLVETIGDRQLAGGLIGLGDRPIPWG